MIVSNHAGTCTQVLLCDMESYLCSQNGTTCFTMACCLGQLHVAKWLAEHFAVNLTAEDDVCARLRVVPLTILSPVYIGIVMFQVLSSDASFVRCSCLIAGVSRCPSGCHCGLFDSNRASSTFSTLVDLFGVRGCPQRGMSPLASACVRSQVPTILWLVNEMGVSPHARSSKVRVV